MGRKPKPGIDFAGWSVNIFDGDTKIDKLLEAQGWQGFSIYFYLCQMAYKFDGYFYKWSYDDSTTTARRMGGGIRSETVKATVNTCFRVGLFHKGLFEKYGILTSRGIQRKYYAVVQSRRVKTVNADFWLLDAEECAGLSLQRANADLQEANAGLQDANADLQAANSTGSKGKESKGEFPTSSTALNAAREEAAGGMIGPRPPEVKQLCAYFEKKFNRLCSRELLDQFTLSFLDGASEEFLRAVVDNAMSYTPRDPPSYIIRVLKVLQGEGVKDLTAYRARNHAHKQKNKSSQQGDQQGERYCYDSEEGTL